MANPDFRVLCAELLEALLENAHPDDTSAPSEELTGYLYPLVSRARTALSSAPQQEVPSDEELLQIAESAAHIDDMADAHEEGYPLEVTTIDILEICRAVLVRYGSPTPQQVADGEVAELVELVEWCNRSYREWAELGEYDEAAKYQRTAVWLTHLALPLPEAQS